MAKRKRRRKVTLKPGQCKVINTKGGRRNLCKSRRTGRVKFQKMGKKQLA